MKEVLTKRFWQSVRKTFDDALEGRSAEVNAAKAPPTTAQTPLRPRKPPLRQLRVSRTELVLAPIKVIEQSKCIQRKQLALYQERKAKRMPTSVAVRGTGELPCLCVLRG
jgi:hypothetical protein